MNKTGIFTKNVMNDLLDINPKVFFVLICLISFLLLYIKKNYIEYEIAAFEILEEKGQAGVFHLLSTLQYFSIPAVYLYKFTITALVLWLGAFTYGYRITFSKCWQIAMVSEIIFIIPEIIKIGWFLFVKTDPDYWTVRTFYPFSLMNFFNYENIDHKWLYPLKALNLFEIIYWFLLIEGIHLKAGKQYKRATLIVGTFYVVSFIGWLFYYVMVYK